VQRRNLPTMSIRDSFNMTIGSGAKLFIGNIPNAVSGQPAEPELDLRYGEEEGGNTAVPDSKSFTNNKIVVGSLSLYM
jgi:hypothetical protein